MIKIVVLACWGFLIGVLLAEIKSLDTWKKRIRKLGDEYEQTIYEVKQHTEIIQDSFTEMEENILNEVSEAIKNLETGRYEETHNILTCLADTVGLDIASEKAKKKN